MSDISKKKTSFVQSEFDDQQNTGKSALVRKMRPHRKVSPMGFRVLVKIRKEAAVSEGGLYLPEGSKQNMAESIIGQVIEVASANDETSENDTNISGIPLGATVLISKFAGIKLPWDENLRLVETKDILAIVEEVELD